MPLLDHFHPPLSRTHPSRGFHGAWAAAMARLLNAGVLPPGYYAVPFLDRDGPVEVDVATFREFDPAGRPGGVATLGPGRARVGGRRRMAGGRRRAGGGVRRRRRPAADGRGGAGQPAEQGPAAVAGGVRGQVRRLPAARVRIGRGGRGHDPPGRPPRRPPHRPRGRGGPGGAGGPSAVSYRAVGRDEEGRLLAWPAALEVGQPLPTVPLWLGADLAVPLDLEASHAAACVDLRIRQAG